MSKNKSHSRKKKEGSRITDAEFSILRNRLFRMKKDVKEKISRIKGAAHDDLEQWGDEEENTAFSFYPMHNQSEEVQKELELDLAAHELETMAEIDRALDKMRDGYYGVCEQCGGDIAIRKLESRPQSRLCKQCEERVRNKQAA